MEIIGYRRAKKNGLAPGIVQVVWNWPLPFHPGRCIPSFLYVPTMLLPPEDWKNPVLTLACSCDMRTDAE